MRKLLTLLNYTLFAIVETALPELLQDIRWQKIITITYVLPAQILKPKIQTKPCFAAESGLTPDTHTFEV